MSLKRIVFLTLALFCGAHAPLHAQEKLESSIRKIMKADPLVQAQLITATGWLASSIGFLLRGNWPPTNNWFRSVILFAAFCLMAETLGERLGQLPDKDLQISLDTIRGLNSLVLFLGVWGRFFITGALVLLPVVPPLLPIANDIRDNMADVAIVKPRDVVATGLLVAAIGTVMALNNRSPQQELPESTTK